MPSRSAAPFSKCAMRRAVSCPIFRCLDNGDDNTVAHFRDARVMVKCTKGVRDSKIPPENEASAMRHLNFHLEDFTDTLLAPHHECVAAVLDSLVMPQDSLCDSRRRPKSLVQPRFVYTYLTTRYYPLPDLFTFCSHFGRGPPWPVVKRLAANLACALAVCHMHDVAHGDIKPENILVNASDLSVKLIDFAFARRGVIHMTKNKHSVKAVPKAGTEPYLAPELRFADNFSLVNPVLVDVYALGITLAFVVSGTRVPVDDYSCIAQGIPRVVKGELLSEGWPRSFFDAAKRCCAHWPPDRPSALELLGLLAHC